ncbi:HvfC/BufC N-terminal domain-containing protein [Pseudoduganella aquatica]|uniref:DUF2063 domain-containing protein n=1 Tax=Pseudoduganella aquatica TaxID=2660641 RepID=A0A7X4H6R3_9BURK|nr:putative DNA-binding domain-containing protein [Pseudoduganella aquatica]MYN05748.1 DUF2063 domain-containing protein [Pseudoduganella aquatica]
MSALQTLQHQFQDYILNAPPNAGAPEIAAAINAGSGLSATERLAIYHRAYRGRLREALCEAYDKTWSYIGDEMFSELADTYLTTHPSVHRNLRWFGGGLADHAAQLYREYPFLAELARLEWALGLAFDAADATALTHADLAAVAPEQWGELVLALHPSLQIVAFEWNAVALWQAMAAGLDAPEPQQLATPTHWLVWRQSGQPHFRSLTALETRALHGLADGLAFGAMCGAVCQPPADADATMLALAGFLQHWLSQEILVRS